LCFVIARTARQVMDAQRVRWRVYGEEEGLLCASVARSGREVDARDDCEGTTHFIAYSGREPVATVRLLRRARGDGGQDGCLGLDIEAKFDLGALCRPGIVAAEVTRFCALRRCRSTGVTKALFWHLYAESERLGVTHWVAGANTQTDCAEDAALAYRVARARRLVNDGLRAEPRVSDLPSTPRRRPYYTEEQRLRALVGDLAGLDLPRPLSVFAGAMGGRYIGPPVYDGYFNVFALPLVATLADLAAQRGACSGRYAAAEVS
jgi:hypothetical protein